jgi:hypothetical protein
MKINNLLSRGQVGSVASIKDETKVEDDMSPLRRHMCLDWTGRGTIPSKTSVHASRRQLPKVALPRSFVAIVMGKC